MKKTWWQQQQETGAAAKPKPPAPAAGEPQWLKDLIAVLEAILGTIPILEGHTLESAKRDEVLAQIARLKEGLPK